MLQSIRDNSGGWIVWTIIGLIVAAFALTGFGGLGGFGSAPKVADFDGTPLYEQTYKDAYQGYLRETGAPDNEETREKAFYEIVDQFAFPAWQRQNGFVVPDAVWKAKLKQDPRFQDETGKFSQVEYDKLPDAVAVSMEQNFINEMQQTQVRRAVLESSFVLPYEADNLSNLLSQERDVNLVRLPVSEQLPKQTVTEPEAQAYYNDNSSSYMQPERMQLKYLDLTLDKVSAGIEIDDEVLVKYYDTNKGRYLQPATREIGVIRVKAKSTTEEGWAEAKTEAQAVYDKVSGGADINAIEGHAASTMTVTSTETSKEQEFAFSVKEEGTVIQPARIGDAYTVIRLNKINKESIKPLAEVKADVIKDYRKDTARAKFEEAAKEMDNLASQGGSDLAALEKAAQAVGLTIQTSDWFTRSAGTGVAANADVRAEAFQSIVLEENQNSDAIRFGDADTSERVVIIRKGQYEDEKVKPFAEVKAQAEAAVKQQKAEEAVASIADQLIKAAEDGGFNAKLTELKVEKETLGYLSRTDFGKMPAQVSIAAFSMKKPDGKPLYKVVESGDDRYLIELNAVKTGVAAEGSTEYETAKQIVSSMHQKAEFPAFRRAARIVSDYELFPKIAYGEEK